MKIVYIVVFLSLPILILGQFPSLKGKDASGIFSRPTLTSPISNSKSYNISLLSYDVTSSRVSVKRIRRKARQDESTDFFSSATLNTLEVGVGLDDYIFNPIENSKKLSFDASYTINLRSKGNPLAKQRKDSRNKRDLKRLKKGKKPLNKRPKPKWKKTGEIKEYSNYESDNIKFFLNVSAKEFLTEQPNKLLEKKTLPYLSFGVDVSKAYFRNTKKYGSGPMVSLGLYLGGEINTTAHLSTVSVCSSVKDSLTLDSKVVDLNSCSDIGFGDAASTMLGKIKLDFTTPINNPGIREDDPKPLLFRRPRLFFISRLSLETMPSIKGKVLEADILAGVSIAKGDRVPLFSFLISLKELVGMFSSDDDLTENIDDSKVTVQVGIPLNRS